jgi:hypothetical protein
MCNRKAGWATNRPFLTYVLQIITIFTWTYVACTVTVAAVIDLQSMAYKRGGYCYEESG